jgi:flavin reductase (DIM6/NTAB) family NADH-FMN oxidoreductase RutF
MLAVGINRVHHTPEGIKENGTFSVNIPNADMVDEVDYCGLVSGRKADKSGLFQVFYGDLKTAPMINECPICIECKVFDTIELPSNYLIIGQIMGAFADEKCLTDDKPDVEKIDPIVLTMPDNRYWRVGKYAGASWGGGREPEGLITIFMNKILVAIHPLTIANALCPVLLLKPPMNHVLDLRGSGVEDLLEDLLGHLLAQGSCVDHRPSLNGPSLSLAWPFDYVQASMYLALLCPIVSSCNIEASR